MTAPLRASIEDLTLRAFASFDEARHRVPGVVVQPAVPILFFGDLHNYLDSPLRIVTVGLNPSLAEFPPDDPFSRFRESRKVTDIAAAGAVERYIESLSSYYRADEKPYRRWFGCYEPLLNGAGASYYGGQPNFALHTDICSPVATEPTWSHLDPRTRSILISSGAPLWNDLIRSLRPHVVVLSVARQHLGNIAFEPREGWSPFFRLDRARPYVVERRGYALAPDFATNVVYGPAAQTPFGLVTFDCRMEIGAHIRDWHARNGAI